jgi:hypothetical protein
VYRGLVAHLAVKFLALGLGGPSILILADLRPEGKLVALVLEIPLWELFPLVPWGLGGDAGPCWLVQVGFLCQFPLLSVC